MRLFDNYRTYIQKDSPIYPFLTHKIAYDGIDVEQGEFQVECRKDTNIESCSYIFTFAPHHSTTITLDHNNVCVPKGHAIKLLTITRHVPERIIDFASEF